VKKKLDIRRYFNYMASTVLLL